jgi:hypothetical protein
VSVLSWKSRHHSRGGQPGNTNALKHGFYSRRFRDIEFSDLDVITVADLQNEIAMMRVLSLVAVTASMVASGLAE